MRVPARLKLLALASVAMFVAANLTSLVDLQRVRDAAPRTIEGVAAVQPPAAAPAPGERAGLALLGRRAP